MLLRREGVSMNQQLQQPLRGVECRTQQRAAGCVCHWAGIRRELDVDPSDQVSGGSVLSFATR
ncbi:hypothetical protein GDO81_002913 [Engystomops pustulosus]|uniref:Uncharacterized protein n=1 Tax=Engystomops pustulosus TaxID=76066 RepID=A0AAV7DNR3_ENGPU|nr:hypothetical protein GDO81_002913 [Engystomops pustulosus]